MRKYNCLELDFGLAQRLIDEARDFSIEADVARNLPESSREDAKKRAKKIVGDYLKFESAALAVLKRAAERGRFYEFAERLERNYEENLQSARPEARRPPLAPGAVKTESFFLECFEELGIEQGSAWQE